MLLSSEVYEEIKNEVVHFFIEYGINSIPINAFHIAQKMGVVLRPYSSLKSDEIFDLERGMISISVLAKMSGDAFLIVDENGKEYIFYNDSIQPLTRQNRSVLHEIAHLVLGHQKSTPETEAEADFFAKYAAAPPPIIQMISPTSYMDIADVFGLGPQAALHTWDYYHVWLRYWAQYPHDYEVILRELFSGYKGAA